MLFFQKDFNLIHEFSLFKKWWAGQLVGSRLKDKVVLHLMLKQFCLCYHFLPMYTLRKLSVMQVHPLHPAPIATLTCRN